MTSWPLGLDSRLMWTQALQPMGEPYRSVLAPQVSSAEAWHVTLDFRDWEESLDVPKLTKRERYKQFYNKTRIVGDDGQLSVGEIELVRRLRAAGYQAGWVDTFGGAPDAWAKWILRPERFPKWLRDANNNIRELLKSDRNDKTDGMPDVVAWTEDKLTAARFVEYKGLKDTIRKTQEPWIRAALLTGVDDTSIVAAKRVKVRASRLRRVHS